MSELLYQSIGRKHLIELEKLVALEMLGHSVAACARILNVSRETLYTWRKEFMFLALKEREKSDFVQKTADAIIAGQLDGIRLLVDCVQDNRIPKEKRVEAARILVDLGAKAGHKPKPDEKQLSEILWPRIEKPQKKLPAPAPAPELKEGQ
jgi:transposase-like protein